MKFHSLFRVELGRLFRSRLTWAALGITIAAPVLGLTLYSPLSGSLNCTFLANPALAGALAGALIFALLTVLELDRVHRSRTDVLTDSMVSPLAAEASRTLALLTAAAAAVIAAVLIWLPITAALTGAIFRPGLCAAVYLLVILPALWFAILFTASAYQLVRRLDITLVAFTGFFLLSLTAWSENWLLRWVNPALAYLSDDFGNLRRLMSLGWNRLFWLLALGGLWCLCLLCTRRYGKGAFGSLIRNARKFYLPVLSVVLAAASFLAYTKQPFIDHSEKEIDYDAHYDFDYNEHVTYSAITVDAQPSLSRGLFRGTADFTLHNDSGQPQTISFWINPGYTFRSVMANGRAVPFRDLNDDSINQKTIELDIPADENIELIVEYGGFPKEWNIMSLYQGETEISDDYIYLAHQDFSPMPRDFAEGTREQAPLTARITLPDGLRPVLFGTGEVEAKKTENGSTQWVLHDAGWSLILYAGDYISEQIDAAGLNVEFFYSARHQRVMEECRVNDTLKQVFEYCTDHYGPLSFYGDEGMRLIEIGAVGGGYAAGGASVMGEDSFSEAGLKDPLKGAGGSEVMAHEIIHQWWGLGNMVEPVSEADPWSAEGLTVYTTYRLMKELHGADYAQKYYVDVWQSRVADYYQDFYVRNPEFLSALPEQYRADIANSQSTVRRYCEMPLKILKAEKLVGGEEAMDQILSGLFTGETNPSYPYLTWQDFLDACNLSEEDLNLG